MSEELFDSEQKLNYEDVSTTDSNGFDLDAGKTWIYPTNYTQRDYQFNIIKEALYKNTLLSLPTGLGKTFIAAVLMYNFFRWYPNSKIIFMAPTRPLVTQQIDACYNIMAIPQSATAELTGTKTQTCRKDIWQTKRVFFITPQVLQNDLDHVPGLATSIRCLVFDEAHKAKGNHAYCEVIRKVHEKNKLFRVLALSATPGSSVKDVLEVIENLLISHLEFRSEESDDVKQYVFDRSIETVVVPLGDKLQQVKADYLKILERYTRNLIKFKVIQGNCSNLTKGKIFMVMKEFQARNERTANHIEILRDLNVCVTLYHAYEVLVRHGLRGFLNFFQEHINKPLLKSSTAEISGIMKDIEDYLGPAPNLDPLPDGSYPPMAPSTKFGHPKFYHLRDILVEHFGQAENANNRVIVFFEYRESVMEAQALLLQSRPTIKPKIFLGQGYGITQKIQINVIKSFRDGINCNTLLSTCIGEEGLDVGDVNLIVCFDISNKSPIRMIQRMGRTGRKKDGKVVILVTEGREQQTLKDCLIYKNNLNVYVLKSPQLLSGMYKDNPRMVPDGIEPSCERIFITVQRSKSEKRKVDLDEVEIVEITERLPSLNGRLHCLGQFSGESSEIFSRHLEKQKTLQYSSNRIKHSVDCDALVKLFQFGDAKRFNIPSTQNNQKNLKQGDIRAMFTKNANELTDNSNEKSDVLIQKFPSHLFLEMTVLLQTIEVECKFCKLFDDEICKLCYEKEERIDLNGFNADLAILDAVTSSDFVNFQKTLIPKSEDDEDFAEIDFGHVDELIGEEISKEEKLEDIIDEKSFGFQLPKGFDNLVLRKSICCSPAKLQTIGKVEVSEGEVLSFFKLDNLSDIFNVVEKLNETNLDSSIKSNKNLIVQSPDLFEDDSCEEIFKTPPATRPKTPEETSPILGTFNSSLYKSQISRNKFRKESEEIKQSNSTDISEFCDLEIFGISSNEKDKQIPTDKPIVVGEKTTTNSNSLEIEDICNISDFFCSDTNLNLSTPSTSKTMMKSQQQRKKRVLSLKQTPKTKIEDSEDEFETFSATPKSKLSLSTKKSVNKIKRKVTRKANCDFIETQAILSEDENAIAISSDEHESDEVDEYEKSFVNDQSHYIPDTQMHAVYLKSVKSPTKGRGIFKIPARPKNDVSFIFSQQVEQDDYYEEDSFCVDTLDESVAEGKHDLSELEVLELKLKEQRRNKRKKHKDDLDDEDKNVICKNKRRRIVVLSSDSD